ncbi:hypothetical protein MPNT_120071 [Candidatus Methylacidithermus pantelleriae]|uniref:Uncharacterized protein n=1 Tax=Candidatus Methylacidithermus pantelleriae TaxID=2744239 RepID=A0A8J2BRQ3_9BACT|nr:hypothetical protein MPNT_120071 [Candidatus Methylacidithermus pantelleriae]
MRRRKRAFLEIVGAEAGTVGLKSHQGISAFRDVSSVF